MNSMKISIGVAITTVSLLVLCFIDMSALVLQASIAGGLSGGLSGGLFCVVSI